MTPLEMIVQKEKQTQQMEILNDAWLYHDDISNDDCDFIDTPPSSPTPIGGIYIDWESWNENPGYHMRVTCERKAGEELINEYITKFKPVNYIVGYEEVDENHHIHCHLMYDKVPSKQSISQWMKTRQYNGKYYHQQVKTTNRQNMLYVVKELDLVTHNLSPKMIAKLKELTDDINENKKMNQRHKLLIEYDTYLSKMTSTEITSQLFTLPQLARWIMNYYITVYDKEPPLAHLKGYTLYIASKCKVRESYSYQLNNLFTNLF